MGAEVLTWCDHCGRYTDQIINHGAGRCTTAGTPAGRHGRKRGEQVPEPTVQFNVLMPKGTKARLEARAAAEDRSVSAVIRVAIEQYLGGDDGV